MHERIREDFTLRPAHAYRLAPAAGSKALAKARGSLHIVGGILMPAGVAVLVTHGPGLTGHPYGGSEVTLAAVAPFAVIVFRTVPA